MIQRMRRQKDVLVVDLSGRCDASTAPATKRELQKLIEEGDTRVVVNLSGLSFIDSSGLGALVSCQRRATNEGGGLRIADVPPFAASIFHLTRLTRVFNVRESEQQAVDALAQSGSE